jgi:hypothetical protein
MELNPVLLDAVARIGAGVKAPVAFQFFPLRYELYTIVIIALPSALTTFSIILNVTLASR